MDFVGYTQECDYITCLSALFRTCYAIGMVCFSQFCSEECGGGLEKLDPTLLATRSACWPFLSWGVWTVTHSVHQSVSFSHHDL